MELFEVSVMFAAVALMGVLAGKLGQSVIAFYIGDGVPLTPLVAGELGLGLLAIEESIEVITLAAELGIVFLLFSSDLSSIDTSNAFAVGYVLVMSIVGSVLMQYSAVERRLAGATRGLGSRFRGRPTNPLDGVAIASRGTRMSRMMTLISLPANYWICRSRNPTSPGSERSSRSSWRTPPW